MSKGNKRKKEKNVKMKEILKGKKCQKERNVKREEMSKGEPIILLSETCRL